MGVLNKVLRMFGKGKRGGGGFGELMEALIEQFGGVDALLDRLKNGGLESQLATWVGGGENASLSTEKLTAALGSDNIQGVADKLGIGQGEATAKISSILPRFIDRLTPLGEVPEGGIGADTLDEVLSRLLGR